MDILYTVEEKYLQAVDELTYGEFPKALRYFNEIIQEDATYARAYYQLGCMYYYQFRNYQAAGYYYKQCIALEAEFPDVYEHYLRLLIELRMVKTIDQVAKQALVVPGVCLAHIYGSLGRYAEEQQKFAEAHEHYRKAALVTACQTEHAAYQDHLKRIMDKQHVNKNMVYIYNGG